MSFLRGRQGFSLTIISACAIVVIVIGYLLTGWNLDNFKDDKLTIMMGVLSFIGIILLATIPYGFKARVERFHKKSDHEIDLRAHTLKVCKEVYEPLLNIIVGTNPNALYEIQFKVVNRLNQDGNPSRRLIPVEELPDLDYGIEHLRTHKGYQDTYRSWEEARALRRKYNEKHEELNQEINKMVVEKAKKYLPSFSEYESAQSPTIQSYFSSERFMNAIFVEIQGLIRDPKLRPDHRREFRIEEQDSKEDGHWWWLVWWDNGLLRSRDSFTNQGQDNVRRILTEILSDPKVAQIVRELFKLHDQEITVQVNRFKEQLKSIVDMINDKQFTNILQGNCRLCR